MTKFAVRIRPNQKLAIEITREELLRLINSYRLSEAEGASNNTYWMQETRRKVRDRSQRIIELTSLLDQWDELDRKSPQEASPVEA